MPAATSVPFEPCGWHNMLRYTMLQLCCAMPRHSGGPQQVSRPPSFLLVCQSELSGYISDPRTCNVAPCFVLHWHTYTHQASCMSVLCYQPAPQQKQQPTHTNKLPISMAVYGKPAKHLASGPCCERLPGRGKSRGSPPPSPSCP